MGFLRRLQDNTDDGGRTATVDLLWEMGPQPRVEDWGEGDHYGRDIAELAIVCGAVGLVLIVFYALYRCVLHCRACCCKASCCTCVETSTKGKGVAFRLVLIFLLMGCLASILSYTRGQALIEDAVHSIAQALAKISRIIGSLQGILGSMTGAVGGVTTAVSAIQCNDELIDYLTFQGGMSSDPRVVIDGALAMLNATNRTLSQLAPSLADFKEPVDDLERELTNTGPNSVQYWLKVGVPAFVSAPFAIFLLLSLLGLVFSICKLKTPTSCCLNLGACWAGGPGLTMALVIFVALFIVSITLADFCYLGPAAVLTQKAGGDEQIGYYLGGCHGVNPLEQEVDVVAAAVTNLTSISQGLGDMCTPDMENLFRCVAGNPTFDGYDDDVVYICNGVDEATAALDAGVATLNEAVASLKADVLNCSKFEPIMEHVFYDGVCAEAVEGLYSIWVVVVAAAVCTYMALLILPFATAAFDQEGLALDEERPKELYKGTSGITLQPSPRKKLDKGWSSFTGI